MARDHQQFDYFYHVAQTLSFTKAAQRCQCSKSHISKAISKLEAHLQTKLFQRNTRQLILTQAGESLYETVSAMHATLDKGLDVLQHINDTPMGKIKISAPPAFSEAILAPIIMDFLKAYPNIELSIDCNNSFVDIIEGGFDVVFRSAVLSDSNLIAQKLCSIQFVCVTANKQLAKQIQHPEQLKAAPSIVYDTGKQFKLVFNQANQTSPIIIEPMIATNLSSMIKACVLQGDSIAVLPSFMVENDFKQQQLFPVLPKWSLEKSPVYMVYPSRHYMPLKVKHFIQFIKQACESLT